MCLLLGASWIFVSLFQPSVFTARYELTICLAFPTEAECVYCAARAVWLFQPTSVFTARYELNICLAFPTEGCVYCAVRAEYLFGFSNRRVCLLCGTSWIFVWLFQPRRSVFTARYELNLYLQYWLVIVFIKMLVETPPSQLHNPEARRVVEMKSEAIFVPPN
jgi:hypothetical protein